MERLKCYICNKEIEAIKASGKDVYPHRPDLANIVIWVCPDCGGYVGSHKSNGKPLGDIVSKEVKDIRISIHNSLDPLWRTGRYKRKELYAMLSAELGWTYHTAKIRSADEGKRVLTLVQNIRMYGDIKGEGK